MANIPKYPIGTIVKLGTRGAFKTKTFGLYMIVQYVYSTKWFTNYEYAGIPWPIGTTVEFSGALFFQYINCVGIEHKPDYSIEQNDSNILCEIELNGIENLLPIGSIVETNGNDGDYLIVGLAQPVDISQETKHYLIVPYTTKEFDADDENLGLRKIKSINHSEITKIKYLGYKNKDSYAKIQKYGKFLSESNSDYSKLFVKPKSMNQDE